MIISYHDKYVRLKKDLHRNTATISDFLKIARSNLFDICCCKCLNFDLCECSEEKRVPIQRRSFLVDQRTNRQMKISLILCDDTAVTINQSPVNEKQNFELYSGHPYELKSAYKEGIDETNKTPAEQSSPVKIPTQNRTKLTNTVQIVQRYNLPSRPAAALATAVLIDYKIITKNDTSQVIGKNKIVRETERVAKEILSSDEGFFNLTGLYFDGRRDDTVKQIKIGNKFYKKVVKEEHYSLLKEPGSEYVGHVSPVNGEAITICNTIIEYFSTEDHGDLSKLRVVGCDGILKNIFNLMKQLIIKTID